MIKSLKGVGLNLRLDFIDEFLEVNPDIPFVEVILDNYHSEGPHHRKLEKVRENYEVSFHCVGMNLAGTDDLNLDYLKRTRDLIEKFDPFSVSDHLCFQAFEGVAFHDLLPFPLNEEFLLATTHRVSKVQEFLNRNILIENLSYYCEFNLSEMKEYEFLNQLTKNSGSEILLDLNNIWVNEKNLSHSSLEYINNIAWERVKEVHVAGAEVFDGTYIDTHGDIVSDEVIEILKNTSANTADLPIVYERDNNIPPFEELLKERARIQGVVNEL